MEKEVDEARKQNILEQNLEEIKAFQFMVSALVGEQSRIKAKQTIRLERQVEGSDIEP